MRHRLVRRDLHEYPPSVSGTALCCRGRPCAIPGSSRVRKVLNAEQRQRIYFDNSRELLIPKGLA
jgi:hypothetical protein